VIGNLSSQESNEAPTMTTVQITLPDELAQKAASAGLLSAEAMEAMLREQLRRRAGEALQAMWQRTPQDELTPEIEQEIVEEVRKVRAERRLRGASSLVAQYAALVQIDCDDDVLEHDASYARAGTAAGN
jgi:post-segregation antitoxin (ccd killing protein)